MWATVKAIRVRILIASSAILTVPTYVTSASKTSSTIKRQGSVSSHLVTKFKIARRVSQILSFATIVLADTGLMTAQKNVYLVKLAK